MLVVRTDTKPEKVMDGVKDKNSQSEYLDCRIIRGWGISVVPILKRFIIMRQCGRKRK